MIQRQVTCEEMSLKVMALLDGELTEDQLDEVKNHLASCEKCSKEYASLKNVKEVTEKMKFKKLPEFYWDDYWKHIYNRIERGLSWILLSIGAVILLCFAGWEFLDSLIADRNMNPILKGGIFIFSTGIIILIVSIIREKLMVRRVDKYKEIER